MTLPDASPAAQDCVGIRLTLDSISRSVEHAGLPEEYHGVTEAEKVPGGTDIPLCVESVMELSLEFASPLQGLVMMRRVRQE